MIFKIIENDLNKWKFTVQIPYKYNKVYYI